MNLITPDGGLLFWMVLIFGIVLFILAKWGFPVITSAVDSRSARIEESLRQAEQARAQLAGLAKEQEEMIARTHAEQARILKEAAHSRDEIIRAAREEASVQTYEMLEHARERIEREKQDAIREVRREMALLSVQVAEKVLRDRLGHEEEQLSLARRYADELSASDIAGATADASESSAKVQS